MSAATTSTTTVNDGYQNCLRCAAEACAAGAHDCNDVPGSGANIHPGAPEICNQIDDDCNGEADDGLDLDGDGVLPCGPAPDCRNDPADDVEGEPTAFEINPNADEACDSADNDCDGRVDEGFSQQQPDAEISYTTRANCGRCGNDCAGASGAFNTVEACVDRAGQSFGCSPTCLPGFVDVDGDMGDASQFWSQEPAINGCECQLRFDTICDSGNPDRACAEICNGIDDDCDGFVDEETGMDLPSCWDGAPFRQNVGICRDGVRRCVDGQ